MVSIIKEEIEIDESLASGLNVICDFCNTTFSIENGSIRKIEHTNLTYIEPHRIIINNLKNQPLSNKNLLLSNQNKDKIIDYIEEVSKSTNDFKEITNYSLAVDKIKEDFQENHNTIEDLRKRVKLQNEEI